MKRFGILGCALFIAMVVGCGNDTESIGGDESTGGMAGEGSGGGSSETGGADSGGSDTGGKASGGGSNTGGKSSGGSAGEASGGMGGEETGGTGGTVNGPVCGNEVLDGTEECDTNDFGGEDCTDHGFTGGALSCTNNCLISTANCANPACDAPVELAESGTVSGTTVGALNTVDIECGSDNPESGTEVAYTYTAAESGTLVVSVKGDADFILSVEPGTSCGQASESCADNEAEEGVETVPLEVAEGETFTIIVDGYDDAASSAFTLFVGVNQCSDFDACTVDTYDAEQQECFSTVPHDVCEEGDVLSTDSACTDPQTACVQAVCDHDALCCNGSWDDTCVGHVATYCDITCN